VILIGGWWLVVSVVLLIACMHGVESRDGERGANLIAFVCRF
jgi:hypothetical protein